MAPIAAAARTETRDGERVWTCPNCGQTLARIVGERIVIEAGKIKVTLARRTEPEGCPK